MAKAVFNDTVIAEYDDIILLEGTHYFPPESVHMEYLRPSKKQTECSWKGTAHYYHLVVGGSEVPDAAWYFPQPTSAARAIKDHVAFSGKVRIEP